MTPSRSPRQQADLVSNLVLLLTTVNIWIFIQIRKIITMIYFFYIVAKPTQIQRSDSSASSKSSASSASTDSSSDSESSESITSTQPSPKKKETQASSTQINTVTSVPPKRPSAAVAPVKAQKCTKRQSALIHSLIFL